LLLEAFVSVAAENPELHLVMAGPGAGTSFADELHAKAEASGLAERIHWPGMLLGDATWGAFAACAIVGYSWHLAGVLQKTVQDDLGVLAHVISCGKPVLLSDQVNIAPDVLADGCGFVEGDSLVGTQRALTAYLGTSEAALKTMSEQAVRTFATRYDMRKNTEIILNSFLKDAR
jgi:glycosyltransferase involved in cell wall biosynthesis